MSSSDGLCVRWLRRRMARIVILGVPIQALAVVRGGLSRISATIVISSDHTDHPIGNYATTADIRVIQWHKAVVGVHHQMAIKLAHVHRFLGMCPQMSRKVV